VSRGALRRWGLRRTSRAGQAFGPRLAAGRERPLGLRPALTLTLTSVLALAAAGATVAPSSTIPTAAPLGLTPAPVPGDERVAIRLPPDVTFEVNDLAAGTFAALQPFALSFHGARLAPGRTLRISVRVDTQLAPGIAVSFRCRNPQGGNCSSGSLSAATFTEVFTGAGGITAGGCELAWTLACGAKVRRAGRYAVTMRWQIESVISDRDAALAAARSALPLLAPFGSTPGRIPAVGAPKTGAPAGGGAALPPVKAPP
jgi:hypothetical protein